MSNEFDVNDLEGMESGGLSEEDIESYSGTKTTIEHVRLVDDVSRYGNRADGTFGELPNGETVKTKKVEVETAAIGTDRAGNAIKVRARFNLKQDKLGKWVWSKHEKSKLHIFMQSLKVNHPKDCVGKSVVVVKKMTNKGKPMLGISF